MKIITLYDGTIQSKAALEYGLVKTRENQGELIVLHVFQSSLFIDYDAGLNTLEIAQAESRRFLRDAEAIIRESGQAKSVRIVSEEGEPEGEVLRLAEIEHPDLILVSARYRGIARSSQCPVQIIPGIILVPVDSSDVLRGDLDLVSREAELSGSSILLMGIIPVHLYNAEEKDELDHIRQLTEQAVHKISQILEKKGLEVSTIVRSGYPDEEILKTADEYAVSLIMLPTGGEVPSELTKAASILIDEPQRVKKAIYLMQTAAV